MKRLMRYFKVSFQRKLLLFTSLLVIVTAIFLSVFLISNMKTISRFSLEQNELSLKSTVKNYLNIYTVEKATSTMLNIRKALGNLTILGEISQDIFDNYDDVIDSSEKLFSIPIFHTDLELEDSVLTTNAAVQFDAFIPPYLTNNQAAKDLLEISGLLNPSLAAIQKTYDSQSLIYFVGNIEAPVTRAYPNKHLKDILGKSVNLHFWNDFFPRNVNLWKRWYTDASLQEQWPSPITVEAPYADAAGNGIVMTMFYPLWNSKENKFAGAIGLDLSLNNIITDLFTIQVAKTGFAFLINNVGEIIAMPEFGYKLLGIQHEKIILNAGGKLPFQSGLLNKSSYSSVRDFSTKILRKETSGIESLILKQSNSKEDVTYLFSFASLPPLANNQYEANIWKLGVLVSEAEILQIVDSTETKINYNSDRTVIFSIFLVLGFIFLAIFISVKFSHTATKDLRFLSLAAEQISKKNYNVVLNINGEDEISQLGSTFTYMAHEIHQYTTNLEEKIADRTVSLQEANDMIMGLNEQLKSENLRMGAEIDITKRLQMMVLPSKAEMNRVEYLDIAGYMQPADEVGGDYYDVLQVGDKVFLGIGDVTGHGLSSGVIMLMVQTAFLSLSRVIQNDLSEILYQLNKAIYHNILRIEEDKNMTLAFLLYQNGKCQVSGQHESVIICRQNGQIEDIDTMDLGFPVGMIEDIKDMISVKDFNLETGDVMLLYTDGVTEAENPEGQQYDPERLMEALAKYHDFSAQEIKENIIRDLFEFINGNTIYDDISLLIVKQK